MAERWFDSEGNEWESKNGTNWIVGFDSAMKKQRTKEEQDKLDKLFAEFDEQELNKPIPVTPPQEVNILGKFLQETANLITFRSIIEKATGKEVKFDD